MYGGSIFFSSAASDTPQGQAIQSINQRWGEDFRKWGGRETIGIPVCKKKYAPFQIRVKKQDNGQVKILVERMYGCSCHSALRKQMIDGHGERKGWEPFGQWSLSKALTLARKMSNTIKGGRLEGKLETSAEADCDEDCEDQEIRGPWNSICNNGKCAWKIKSKYDDIVHDENEGTIVS
jgi:hypothetical protein